MYPGVVLGLTMGVSLEVYGCRSQQSSGDSKLLSLELTSRSQMPALKVIMGAIDMFEGENPTTMRHGEEKRGG